MKRLKKINVLVNFNIREKLQLLIKPISDLREKRLTHKPVEKWLQNLDALSQQDEKQFNKAFRYFFSTTRKNKADNYKLELKIFLKKMSRNKHPEMYYQDLLELKIILQRIMQEQHLSVSRAKSIRKLILAIDCKTKQLKDNHPPYKANIEPVMNNKKEPAKKIFSQAVTMVQGLKKKLLMNKDTRQESISKITGESLEQEFQQLQSECRSLIHSIQKERVGGDKDKLMTQFIVKQQQLINEAKAIAGLQECKNRLESVLKSLNSPEYKAISMAISNLRKGAGSWFAIGKNAKAERIEEAVRNVSVEQRGQMFINNLDVRKALASHRHLGKRGKIYLDKNTQDVDLKRAARTFIEINNYLKSEELPLYCSVVKQ